MRKDSSPTSPSAPPRALGLVAAGAALAAFAWLVWLALALADARTRLIVFQPMNGTFQTFDPVRRMLAGQWPSRDFDVYLGLGPVHVSRLATVVFGGTYRDCVAGVIVVAALLQALVPAALARALGWKRAAAATVGWLAFLGALTPVWYHVNTDLAAWVVTKTSEVATPGYSLLALRCAVPVVALGVPWLAWRAGRFGPAGQTLWTGVAVGVAAGIALPWSNDYGPATAAALIAAAAFLGPRATVRGERVRVVAIAIGVTLLVAALVVTAATGGAPGAWLDYNWSGVARDQTWYFTAGAGKRTPEGLEPWWMAFGLATTVATWLVARRTRSLGDAGAAVVLGASALAGALAAWAQPFDRYFLPLERASVVVAPILIARGLLAWRRRAGRGPDEHTLRRVGAAFVLVGLASGVPAAWIATRDWTRVTPEEARTIARAVDVPELGGRVPAANHKSVELARWIRADVERRGLAPDARVFSTYSTLIDVLADAFQPTRADYVIHALGAARRADYVSTLVARAPAYATTIRADYAEWEAWVRRQNWEVYARLLDAYEPWERTPYAIVWRRTDRPLAAPDVPVELARTPGERPGELRLHLAIDASHAALGPLIVEVELASASGFLVAPGTFPAPRGGVRAVETGATGKDALFALPPDGTSWRFPVEVAPGRPVEIVLSANGAAVRVDRAAARVRLARAALDGFALRRLLPAAESEGGYAAGIARDGAAFVVADPTDLRGFGAGTQLRFAGSGVRTITAVEGRTVRVSGAPLDPATDGCPHWIERVATP